MEAAPDLDGTRDPTAGADRPPKSRRSTPGDELGRIGLTRAVEAQQGDGLALVNSGQRGPGPAGARRRRQLAPKGERRWRRVNFATPAISMRGHITSSCAALGAFEGDLSQGQELTSAARPMSELGREPRTWTRLGAGGGGPEAVVEQLDGHGLDWCIKGATPSAGDCDGGRQVAKLGGPVAKATT